MTDEQVRSIVMSLSDDLMYAVADACGQIHRRTDRPEVRLDCASRRVGTAVAALSAATAPNARVGFVELLTLATLQRVSLEDPEAVARFAEDDRRLLRDTFAAAEQAMWAQARRAITPAQEAELRAMILEWRAAHPDRAGPTQVRLAEFAAMRQATRKPADDAGDGSLLRLLRIDPMQGLDPTTRQLRESRQLAERVAFWGQRMPLVLGWQVELTWARLLQPDPVRDTLDTTARLATAAGGISDSAARLATSYERTLGEFPNERRAAIEQLDQAVAARVDAALDRVTTTVAARWRWKGGSDDDGLGLGRCEGEDEGHVDGRGLRDDRAEQRVRRRGVRRAPRPRARHARAGRGVRERERVDPGRAHRRGRRGRGHRDEPARAGPRPRRGRGVDDDGPVRRGRRRAAALPRRRVRRGREHVGRDVRAAAGGGGGGADARVPAGRRRDDRAGELVPGRVRGGPVPGGGPARSAAAAGRAATDRVGRRGDRAPAPPRWHRRDHVRPAGAPDPLPVPAGRGRRALPPVLRPGQPRVRGAGAGRAGGAAARPGAGLDDAQPRAGPGDDDAGGRRVPRGDREAGVALRAGPRAPAPRRAPWTGRTYRPQRGRAGGRGAGSRDDDRRGAERTAIPAEAEAAAGRVVDRMAMRLLVVIAGGALPVACVAVLYRRTTGRRASAPAPAPDAPARGARSIDLPAVGVRRV